MVTMPYWVHRFLGGTKHFWMAIWECGKRTSLWKTLHVKNRRKCDQIEGFCEVWSTFDSQNDRYYCEVLERLRKRVRVRPDSADTWMLHHDNTFTLPSPWTNFWPKRVLVPQPPYSPDLSPCDFFLFPILKFHLTGCHFGIVDNIQKVVTDQLWALPHEDF